VKAMGKKFKSKGKKVPVLKGLHKIMIAVMILLFAAVGFLGNPFVIEAFAAENTSNYIFLSDLDYLTGDTWSSNGWAGHDIQKDKGQEGGWLSLIVDGETRTFMKGMSVHGTGKVSYDISGLSSEYTRFTAKVGVDASRGTRGTVWFEILVSNDGNTWTSLKKTGVLRGNSESVDIDVSIEGYQYLRIWVDQADGSNGADHGTIANARLVKKDFQDIDAFYTRLHPVEYYDNILNAQEPNYNYQNNYRLILEREFVQKLGYWTIQDSVQGIPNMVETLDWLLEGNERLEQVIEVGEITGVPRFFHAINTLYQTYKTDFGGADGYVYQKMAIALAAGYSTDRVASPLQFGHKMQDDGYYIERFRIMKRLYDEDKLLHKDWFQNYHVALMRMVMLDGLRNDETVWLNEYARKYKNSALGPWAWIKYVTPIYGKAIYQDPEKRDQWVEQFKLEEFDEKVPYGDGIQRYWMVIENGGICWNQGRFVQSVARSLGMPTAGYYQSQHEANFQYSQDADGNGSWMMLNSVTGGWGSSATTWGGGNRYRLLLDWANKPFTDQLVSGPRAGTSISYLILAQANLNRYEQFKQSIYWNLLANSYSDPEKKAEAYNLALAANDLNLDSYDYKIQLYKSMPASKGEWHQLALDIIAAYEYHPVAMFDLLKVVKPYLDPVHKIDIDLKEHAALVNASNAATSVYQSSAVRHQASVLLGKTEGDLATFSFDGENAGKIVLNSVYDTDIRWLYSLDGGATRSEYVAEMAWQLTPEELASITSENDIQIYIVGLSQNVPAFTIDIEEGTLPDTIFANDLENRVVGAGDALEWRLAGDSEWISSRDGDPIFTGDTQIEVRMGYTGNRLPSDSTTYTFTEDNQPDTRRYVSVSHLSIHGFSTEASAQGRYARLAIDGNYHTSYHSAWNGTDTERYITIKLDRPRYISSVEFVPGGGGNGRINNGTVYGSMDGTNWEVLSQSTGWTYSSQANTIEQAVAHTKTFEITNPKAVQYVKIQANRTNGNWFSARHFNLFEDISLQPEVTASVEYSTMEPTNGAVVATLTDISTSNYEILSEGGETHTFTENGSFTFRFRDLDTKVEGEVTAVVDWIDTTPPTGTVRYSTTSPTNAMVIAILETDKDITVTNNDSRYQLDEDGNVCNPAGEILNGYTADEEGFVYTDTGALAGDIHGRAYAFLGNGRFTFEFMDRAGNTNSVTASVTWIDTEPPEAELVYSTRELTNQDVVVTVEFPNETGVVVLNNGGSPSYTFDKNGSFTFKFRDEVGNVGEITAEVNWIVKEAPTPTITYDREALTNQHVKATISFQTADVTITNNEGNATYIFTTNGSFTFEFRDAAGNEGTATATVTWIDREAPTGEIEYSTESLTNQPVSATLRPSEEVTVISNGQYRIDENGDVLGLDGQILEGYTVESNGDVKDADGEIVGNMYIHTFTENGSITFEFEDRAGNRGTAEASVTWIQVNTDIGGDWTRPNPPTPTITYSTTGLTNQNVTVILSFSGSNATITNNGGNAAYTFTENGSFTFTFKDAAGNIGTATATVTWIDKEAPTAQLEYETIGNKVIVRVVNPSEEITYQEGTGIYEFTANGSYEIVFYDKAGNTGRLVAVINTIRDNQGQVEDGSNNNGNTNDTTNSGNNSSMNGGVTGSTNGTTNSGNNSSVNGGVAGSTNGTVNNGSNSGTIENGNGQENDTNQGGANTGIDAVEYRQFTANNVMVEVPENIIGEGGVFKAESFTLTEEFKQKVGALSEYFDLYLEDQDGVRMEITSDQLIKISIASSQGKKLLGVYEFVNGEMKPVDYIENGDNIELTAYTLGQYIVSYDEATAEIDGVEVSPDTTENSSGNNIVLWILMGAGILILAGGVLYFFLGKSKKSEK